MYQDGIRDHSKLVLGIKKVDTQVTHERHYRLLPLSLVQRNNSRTFISFFASVAANSECYWSEMTDCRFATHRDCAKYIEKDVGRVGLCGSMGTNALMRTPGTSAPISHGASSSE